LTDLTKLNGTKYLYFFCKENYAIFENYMLELSKNILSDNDIIVKLEEKNLYYDKDYIFCILETSSFSLIELPNNVLHRGKKNEDSFDKILFVITFSTKNLYDYSNISEGVLGDVELDEIYDEDTLKTSREKYNI
jgi:hypothetical protein